MSPLALLRCLARAARGADGLGRVVDLADEVMRGWKWVADAAARRAELEQVARMPADEFRFRVEAAVRDAAGDQPVDVRARVADYLLQIPDAVRERLRPSGTGPPPDFRIDTPADLALLLPPVPAGPPEVPAVAAEPPRVVIRYAAGPLAGREVVHTEPAVLLFGRAKDCDPRLRGPRHRRVSRRHCFLEVNPPAVRVRDLGSLHGTFVDGNLIGKRPRGRPAAPGYESPEHALGDGAEVWLSDRGEVAFTVRVHAPAPAARECAQCRREVAGPGADRPGEFVCAACRAEVGTVVRAASVAARRGDPDLAALRDYEILDELGHGGMGAVYRARHARTGTVVAVKVVLPKVAANERAVALFRREIRNTMALNHRNVVRCLDHGFSRGAFFLVLEYCDGGSVDGLMAGRGGRLPVDEAVGIALEALDGLEYAHHAPIPFVRTKDGGYAAGEGLVHRDVKPANLFLAGSGAGRAVRVGDYGMAKAFEDAGLSAGTRTGDFGGTPLFLCRKQVVGYKTAGPEVDVWSLAASLYAMLTGRGPRTFPRDRDPWLVILEDDPAPIRRRDPKLPKRLAGVIDAALREEPEMPFKTAAEFKRALEEAV